VLGLTLERADADLCYCRQRLETEFGKKHSDSSVRSHPWTLPAAPPNPAWCLLAIAQSDEDGAACSTIA
jgi:hypothetical protein